MARIRTGQRRVIAMGHSNGSMCAYGFTCAVPARTLCFHRRHGPQFHAIHPIGRRNPGSRDALHRRDRHVIGASGADRARACWPTCGRAAACGRGPTSRAWPRLRELLPGQHDILGALHRQALPAGASPANGPSRSTPSPSPADGSPPRLVVHWPCQHRAVGAVQRDQVAGDVAAGRRHCRLVPGQRNLQQALHALGTGDTASVDPWLFWQTDCMVYRPARRWSLMSRRRAAPATGPAWSSSAARSSWARSLGQLLRSHRQRHGIRVLCAHRAGALRRRDRPMAPVHFMVQPEAVTAVRRPRRSRSRAGPGGPGTWTCSEGTGTAAYPAASTALLLAGDGREGAVLRVTPR